MLFNMLSNEISPDNMTGTEARQVTSPSHSSPPEKNKSYNLHPIPQLSDTPILVFGILSLCFGWLPSLIFGKIGKDKAKSYSGVTGQLTGKAKSGFVLSKIGFIYGLVTTVILAVYGLVMFTIGLVNAFISLDFGAKLQKFWERFASNGAWKRVIGEGLTNTLIIAVSGLVIGIVIGTIIAAVKVMPKYKVIPRILDKIVTVYVGFFRGTPIVVQLLIAYYVLFPFMGINIGSLNTCILVFGLNSGAYVSEIMRGGIMSVDPGQMEAGRALGLSFFTTMMKVVVPQAVKNILPSLGNELIALVKDTSVVSFVAAVDLYKTFTEIGNKSYEYLVPYTFMALIYILLVAIISLGVKLVERKLAKSDRRN